MQTKNPWFMRHNYSYYKLPKALFTEPRYSLLSTEAKIVYAFFVDRTSLSYKNGEKWLDPDGNPFIIFPQTEVAKLLHCGHDKATKVLSELVQAKLVRRGAYKRGQPSRLFVLPFVTVCGKTAPDTAEIPQPALRLSSSEHCGKTAGSKPEEFPDINETHYSKAAAQALVEQNISYEALKEVYSVDTLNTIVSIMTGLICQKSDSVRIGKRDWERKELADHILSLNEFHIQYVLEQLQNNTMELKFPRAYIRTILCDVDNGTVEVYYASKVNRDTM